MVLALTILLSFLGVISAAALVSIALSRREVRNAAPAIAAPVTTTTTGRTEPTVTPETDLPQGPMIDTPAAVAVAVAEAIKRAETLPGDEHERRARVLAATEVEAQALMANARMMASAEAAVIVGTARAEAAMESARAREALREQVAGLAVRGAEAILRREVNQQVHKELLEGLAQELKSRGDA